MASKKQNSTKNNYSKTTINKSNRKNNEKTVKKELSKFNTTTKVVGLFLFVIAVFAGIFTTYYFTKNDTFQLIGETEITLKVGDEYIEQGVKIIAFGKDISDKVIITGTVNTDVADEYVIKYTVDNFRFKNYTLYKKITVEEV